MFKIPLQVVNLNVDKGELVVLIGANGAGKTTLLKTAAGIYKAEGGKVLLDGENTYDNDNNRKNLFYIPDDLYFPMNATIYSMADFYADYHPNFSKKTLENYISLIKMADCQEMVEGKVVENLSRYAVGPIIEHRYFGVSTEIPLNLFSANVTGGCLTVTFDTGFSHISRRYTDLTTIHVMGVLLVDAARDLLMEQRDSIALEVESIQKAQKIYQEYAALAAASLVSKYQGKTRISQKGNRITVNFYLSDSEKAFITFFRDNMPWNIPDSPENPESLRMICSQKNSPFIIVSLSKQDRRYLKK